jgi:AraC-like DNA-binding protein
MNTVIPGLDPWAKVLADPRIFRFGFAGKGGPSIADIAWASGFRDLNHFHRVFRQRFGHTPGATRIDGDQAAGISSGQPFLNPAKTTVGMRVVASTIRRFRDWHGGFDRPINLCAR